jgi:hypothetical protein
VLQNPDLLQHILLHVDNKQLEALEFLDKSWHSVLNCPLMWQKRFAPCAMHRPSRSLYISHNPAAQASLEIPTRAAQPMSRKLGLYGGERWTLRTGAAPKIPSSPHAVQILDQVTLLRAWGLMTVDRTPEERARRIHAERLESLDFLLDRAYRLEHGLSIPIWRNDSLAGFVILPLMAVSIAASVYFTNMMSKETSFKKQLAVFGGYAVSVGFAATFGLTFVLSLCINGDGMVRNMVWAYPDYRTVNRWAHEMAAMQGAMNLPRQAPQPKR